MSKQGAQPGETTVEAGTEIEGTLTSAGVVLLRGSVRGTLSAPSLVVTESGQMIGQVKATQLRSAGALEGAMTADEMYISGTVRDNSVIHARTLEVNPECKLDPGFVVFGNCVLSVGDEPAVRVDPPAQLRGAEREPTPAAPPALALSEAAPGGSSAEARSPSVHPAGNTEAASVAEGAPA